jgi:tRNA pseudouridine38-40 synthase
MRNIFLEIEYDGTDYSGWQYQPQKKTIQGTIENGLKKILHEPIALVGASRTDAGVSALCQCANFLTAGRLQVKAIQAALNSLLPSDIYIKKAYGVHLLFNARFSAKSKIYRYQIIPGRSPLQQRFAWELNYTLDGIKMEHAAQLFIGGKNFRPFCDITNNQIEGRVKVIDLKVLVDENTVILIEANRFLYKMVRRIVGCLVEVGRGKITKNDIIKRLAGKSHQSFMVAPAQGLILLSVKY